MNSPNSYDQYQFVADYYDSVQPYANRPDLDFYVGMAKEAGGPVLELGCGTGRVLIPTAKAGISIVGLDMSENMLRVCKQRLSAESDGVRNSARLIKGDMRNFELDAKFKLVTIPFRPFQHLLVVEEQIECLTCAYKHLEPAGTLAFDVFNPKLESLLLYQTQHEEVEEGPAFVLPDGRKLVRKQRNVSIDLLKQITQNELIYYVTHPDGRQERLVHTFPMRYFFRYEVEHLLYRCGFESTTFYSDFDKKPFGSKYPGEIIVVARKK